MQTPSIGLESPKRRHYLKKIILNHLIEKELSAIADPEVLQHFGHPFKPAQDAVEEVTPLNTKFPILRFVFNRFVCTFPFLDNTDQQAFWQEKVQVFLASFSSKRISSSEDRAESSKREKLALRIRSMLVLLMNAGVHAGVEATISIDEAERRTAETIKHLDINADSKPINGLDVNVAGVRTMQKTHKMRRRKTHSEFVLCTRRAGKEDVIVARRYGAFTALNKQMREEFPGKQLPRLPMKNKAESTSYLPSIGSLGFGSRRDSEEDSGTSEDEKSSPPLVHSQPTTPTKTRSIHRMSQDTSRSSIELKPARIQREKQRLTLRSYLRRVLEDTQLAHSTALRHFLFDQPIKLNPAELADVSNRKDLDNLRIEEQMRFLTVARERAKELDAYMDAFKKDLISNNGLTKIFSAIKECNSIEEMPVQYTKVVEWARIEIASTLYQLFVAADNSSELFTQARRIHSLFPYSVLKNIIRFSNPMTMMRAGIDLFLAQPFGRSSLFQRMFSSALNEDIKELQKNIKAIREKVNDDALCDRIKSYVEADEEKQSLIRFLAQEDDIDLIIALMRTNTAGLEPPLTGAHITKVFLANVAWNTAIEGGSGGEDYDREDARLYGYFTQLMKFYTRIRDKEQMLSLLFDGVTSSLLKDIVTIFYEPLARVYKAAHIHESVMDFSRFADDCIQTVSKAEEQDISMNPNALVQTFIDLTGRHQNSFFHFVHEAHSHDNGLFDNLMRWVELILAFLREGAPKHLDLEEVFFQTPGLDKEAALTEIDSHIRYNAKLKIWRQERLQKRMAAGEVNQEPGEQSALPLGNLSGADFGLDGDDLAEIMDMDSDQEDDVIEQEDLLDPLEAEKARRRREISKLNRRYGQPEEPPVKEVLKMVPLFEQQLRAILAY